MRKIFAGGLWVVLGLVCGACEAEDAGPSPALAEERVGELCESAKDCAEDEFCAVEDGMCGARGSCEVRPSGCERDRAVCGCDGVTYSSVCAANEAGVSVDYLDACVPPGCLSNAECGFGEYCAKSTGMCSDYGDCKARPVKCSAANVPVCGCNGVTYTNACKAAQAGVSVAKSGKC